MADIYERAWGNYAALFEFLTKSEFDDAKGLIQPFNFATLLSYNLDADNYNTFLLMNAANYVGPSAPTVENESHTEQNSTLEHPEQLVDAYGSFLDELDAILVEALEPTERKEYAGFEKKVDDAQDELRDYTTLVDSKWMDYLAAHPGIPPEEIRAERIIWERDFGYSKGIQRRMDTVRRSNARLNAWLRKHLGREYTRLVDAREYYDDRNYKVLLPVMAKWDDPKFKHYWQYFHMQTPLLDLGEFLNNDNVVKSTYSTESQHYKRVETKWRVKAKARWGIFSGGGSSERREMEEISRKSTFEFEISFKRFQEVEIYRSRWYQDVLFRTIGKDLDAYWGPNGLLAAIPTSLLVARGTTIEVKISEEYRKKLEKFFSGGGSVSFGPFFSAGGGYSKDERYMDYKKTSKGFQLSDSDKTIRILGGRVKRFNWEETRKDYYKEIPADYATKAAGFLEAKRKEMASA